MIKSIRLVKLGISQHHTHTMQSSDQSIDVMEAQEKNKKKGKACILAMQMSVDV